MMIEIMKDKKYTDSKHEFYIEHVNKIQDPSGVVLYKVEREITSKEMKETNLFGGDSSGH